MLYHCILLLEILVFREIFMLVTHSFPFSSLCLRLKDGAFYFAPISKWSVFNSMHFALKGILSHVIPYSENTKSDVIFGLPYILE